MVGKPGNPKCGNRHDHDKQLPAQQSTIMILGATSIQYSQATRQRNKNGSLEQDSRTTHWWLLLVMVSDDDDSSR